MEEISKVKHTNYPSRYAVGEIVDLDFQNSKYFTNCIIAAVKFTDYGKVLYDIKIPFTYEYWVTIHDVDSIIVKDPII